MADPTNAAPLDVGAQFASVMHAPVPYLVTITAAFGVIWFAVWRVLEARYKGKIEGLEAQLAALRERMAFRDEKYAELEKKLSGPAQVAVTTTNQSIAFRDGEILRAFSALQAARLRDRHGEGDRFLIADDGIVDTQRGGEP